MVIKERRKMSKEDSIKVALSMAAMGGIFFTEGAILLAASGRFDVGSVIMLMAAVCLTYENSRLEVGSSV